jgi:hypothetical protein
MSSVIRTLGQKKEGLTRFVKPESPSYNNGSDIVLFPFSYSNQVLDITYEGNDFKSVMVDVTGQAPVDNDATVVVRILSGPVLATSLGPNFKAYIRSWRDSTIDAGSPIEIFVAPQLLRVQEGALANLDATSDYTFIVSNTPPSGDNYITGDATNQYNSTYIFKTPLTFTTIEGGVTKYITFKSVLEQE